MKQNLACWKKTKSRERSDERPREKVHHFARRGEAGGAKTKQADAMAGGVLDVDPSMIKANPKMIAGVVAAVIFVKYVALNVLHDWFVELSHTHHAMGFILLMPFVAAAFILLLMVIVTYASFPHDFVGLKLHNPKHFAIIARRTWSSMTKNNYKVQAKDL